MAKNSAKRLQTVQPDAKNETVRPPPATTLRDYRIAKTMMNLSDYLVDWAEQVRAIAEQQRDVKVQQKLVELAEECGRITLLMEPERDISRLN
jgi:hypothetical protein